jgi:hypothetical protein
MKTPLNCKYQIYNGNNTGKGLDRTTKAFKRSFLHPPAADEL